MTSMLEIRDMLQASKGEILPDDKALEFLQQYRQKAAALPQPGEGPSQVVQPAVAPQQAQVAPQEQVQPIQVDAAQQQPVPQTEADKWLAAKESIVQQQAAERQRTGLTVEEVLKREPDLESGTDRFLAGTASTHGGKIQILTEKYGAENIVSDDESVFVNKWRKISQGDVDEMGKKLGPENVKLTPDGAFVKQWTKVNPSGPDFGDILGVLPDVIETVPSIFGGLVGGFLGGPAGAMGGAAAGDVVGSGGRQLAGAAFGEDLTAGERALITGTAVAGGLIGDIGAKGVMKVASHLSPKGALRRAVTSGADEKFVKESHRLMKETGVPLDISQTRGTDFLRSLKGMLSQRAGGDQVFSNADIDQNMKLGAHLENSIAKIGGPGDPAEQGGDVATGTKNLIDRMHKQKSREATKDFDAMHAAGEGKKIFNLGDMYKYYSDVATEKATVVRSLTNKQIVENAEKNMENLLKLAKGTMSDKKFKTLSDEQVLARMNVDAKDMNTMISDAAEVARGKKKIIPELEARSYNMALGTRQLNVLWDAVDKTASSGVFEKNTADMMRRARTKYGARASAIKRIQKSVLKRAIKIDADEASDVVIPRLIDSSSPNQLRSARKILNQAGGEYESTLIKGAFQHAMDKAHVSAEMAQRGGKVSAGGLLVQMNKMDKKMKAILEGNKNMLKLWNDTKAITSRIAVTGGVGKGNSQTARMFWTAQVADNLISGGLTVKQARALSGIIMSKKLAERMVDPEQFKDILVLTSKPVKREKLLQIMARMGIDEDAVLAAAEDDGTDFRQSSIFQRGMSL